MSLHNLKPCPFCGGEAGLSSVGTSYMAHCYTPNCIMEVTPYFASVENAVDAWNKRADEGNPATDENRKSGESAFDDVNPRWLSLLLTFLSTDPPRREITVRAESGGKTVNITYDPRDPEAVKAAEVWKKALFADGAQFKAVAPVAVKGGDSVRFAERQRGDYLSGAVEKLLQNKQKYVDQLAAAMEPWTLDKPAETVKCGEPAKPIKARESLLGYEPLIGSNIDFTDKIGYLWEESSSGRGYDLRWRDYPGGDANRVCNLYYDGVEGYYHVKALHEGNADISLKDCTIRALGIKQAMAEAEQLVRKHLQEAAAYSKTRLDKWKPANQATPKADLQQLDRAIRDLSGVIKDDRRGLHAYFDGVDMTYILECLKKYRETVGGRDDVH